MVEAHSGNAHMTSSVILERCCNASTSARCVSLAGNTHVTNSRRPTTDTAITLVGTKCELPSIFWGYDSPTGARPGTSGESAVNFIVIRGVAMGSVAEKSDKQRPWPIAGFASLRALQFNGQGGLGC